MSREQIMSDINELSRKLKKSGGKEISIRKYKRRKIVQDEIVDAYKCPVPSGIVVNGKNKMVEKGNWVLIHTDGMQSTYTEEEFFKIFEVISLGEVFDEQSQTTPNE